MRLRRTFALASAAALIALEGAAAIPASAAPLERGKFHEVVSEVFDDCDLTLLYEADTRGSFVGNTRGPDELAYFTVNLHGTESWTNLATGKSYTRVFNYVEKDHQVTDNGDGTLTILVLAAGGERWYDANGKLLFRDPGQTRFEILIDHGGTPSDPNDDEFLEFLGVVKDSTGRNDLEGRDFCEDIHLVTG
jgi:hypothetical protein